MTTYVVICLSDSQETILATRQIFVTRSVAESYARSLHPDRKPIVVAGDWTELRVRAE
jgi:hypothetical protein